MNTIPMHVILGSLALLIVCGGIGCASVPSTDDIPVVKMASEWGFDVSKLEYPNSVVSPTYN